MDANRIRFVTANYRQLQGLRFIPLGLFLVFWCVLEVLGMYEPGQFVSRDRGSFLTGIGLAYWAALGLAMAAPAYYYFRYGSVDQLNRDGRERWITLAVVAFLLLGGTDRLHHGPVSLRMLLVAAALFITVWSDGRARRHYLLPAVVWLAASFLPALGASHDDTQLALYGLGGLTLIGCGIGDHLLLTRTLARPRMNDDASQHVTV